MASEQRRSYHVDLGEGAGARYHEWLDDWADEMAAELDVFPKMNWPLLQREFSKGNYEALGPIMNDITDLIRPYVGSHNVSESALEAGAVQLLQRHAEYKIYEASQGAVESLSENVEKGLLGIKASKPILGKTRFKIDYKYSDFDSQDQISSALHAAFRDPKTGVSHLENPKISEITGGVVESFALKNNGLAAATFTELAAKTRAIALQRENRVGVDPAAFR